MASRAFAAKLPPMTSDEHDDRPERGRRIRARIDAGKAARQFNATKVADGARVKRQTVDNAMKGKAAPETYAAIEAALDTLEDRAAHPEDYPPKQLAAVPPTIVEHAVPGSDLIEFEVSSGFDGMRIVVRGPVAENETLVSDVARLIREFRANRDNSGSDIQGTDE